MTEINFDGFIAIKLNSRGKAEMQMNKAYITFTHELLASMNFPEYVRLLLNPKALMLAIQECKATDQDAIKFSKPCKEQTRAKYICAKPLQHAIKAVMGERYQGDKYYGFNGTYDANKKIMIFNLSEAYERNVAKM